MTPRALLEHEVYALLKSAGFEVPRHIFLPGVPEKAERQLEDFLEGLGKEDAAGEVVLKIASPDLAHKSDVGGLSLSKK